MAKRLTSLASAADALDREANGLIAAIPVSYPPGDHAIAIAFAHRGVALWRGHGHALKGPSIAAARTILRTLTELPITVAWIWLRPDLHKELWEAEHARHEVAIYRAMPDTMAGQYLKAPTIAPVFEGLFQPIVDKARKRLEEAAQAGAPVRGLRGSALLPSTDEMARQLKAAGQTGHRDIYDISVRYGGQWVHTSAGSFLRMTESPDGLIQYHERPPADTSSDRLEAVGSVASLIWLVDRIADLGLDERCRVFFERYSATAVEFAGTFLSSIVGGQSEHA